MNTQKKLIILAVCVVVVILAICGIVAIVKNNSNKNADNLNEVNKSSEDIIQEYVSGGKTLIVFFSWSGHTEQMADAIAFKTGAKTEILDPVEEYPIDYEECLSVVQSQKASNARPELKSLEVNLDEYTNIFIGYPIWDGDMPMVVYSFLEGNDFSGKTVIPFTTSGSSGESGTFEKIKTILSNSNVLDGYHCFQEEIDSNNFIDGINNWIDSIDVKF